jgi:hypothetical protein
MALPLETIVRVADDVVFRELDGETVLLNLQSGLYFGLDPVGTRMWQLCQQGGSIRSVWETLQSEFDAPADILRSDLLEFVDELVTQGLIRVQ